MKWSIVLILLISCRVNRVSTAVKVVTLDCTPSYIIGGNGKGYFTAYKWVQTSGNKSVIDSPNAPVTKASTIGRGLFTWRVKITDNLNNSDTATLTVDIK